MTPAILFWCYKSLPICEDRVRHLRADNPAVSIYVLFGGEAEVAHEFERALGPYVDDFYLYQGHPGESDATGEWKWRNGDLLLAAWYRDRGAHLAFETVVVVQWDLLIYGSIAENFPNLRDGEILLPGLRPIHEIEGVWSWTSGAVPGEREHYLNFLEFVRTRYSYDDEPLCFPALFMALPRSFLESYSVIERPDLGFLEYRIPIYAQIFGTPLCTDHRLDPRGGGVGSERRVLETLVALPHPISAVAIGINLARPNGQRVFHPYFDLTPHGLAGWLKALVRPWRRRIQQRIRSRRA